MAVADLLIVNAKILTLDPNVPNAEALAIAGERILWLGSTKDSSAFKAAGTRVIDAGGRSVLPGLIDAHVHLIKGSMQLDKISGVGITSLSALKNRILEYRQRGPSRKTLVGYGLDYGLFDPARAVREQLDGIVSDRPLALYAYDLHTVWANTRALEMAGLLHGRATSPGNEVVMGDDGLATGELLEREAFGPLAEIVEPQDPQTQRAAVLEGLKLFASYGLTGGHNMDGTVEHLALYSSLERNQELSIRLDVPFSVTPHHTPEIVARALEMRDSVSGNVLTSHRVKFFMDGVIETGTGFMLEAYSDLPGRYGDPLFSLEHFTDIALEADKNGLQIAVHAIGDAAVRRTLDGLENVQRTNGTRDSRHRIEHIELLHPNDLGRFKTLGVTASMQPTHAAMSLPGTVWANRVGRERWENAFPWNDLRNALVPLVFGTDFPVVGLNPFCAIHNAVARGAWAQDMTNHGQTLMQALAGYTRDAAWAQFREHEKGMLRVGMLADVTMLTQDITTTPLEEIPNLRSSLTVLGGRVVFEG
jgi:predicted amidohydrolase YtcJ